MKEYHHLLMMIRVNRNQRQLPTIKGVSGELAKTDVFEEKKKIALIKESVSCWIITERVTVLVLFQSYGVVVV